MTVWFSGLIHVLPSWLGGELFTIALHSPGFCWHKLPRSASWLCDGKHHATVTEYHSINSFGIAFKFLGIMIWNRCIGFIDLIIWFLQCLINGCYWWLGPSRCLLCCALSRSPPDISVVISEMTIAHGLPGCLLSLGHFLKAVCPGREVEYSPKGWDLQFFVLVWYSSDSLNLGNSESRQFILGCSCQGMCFAFDACLTL